MHQQGIKVLVLDFDGVLGAHAEPEVQQEVKLWLEQVNQSFGAENIFILSNKPTTERSRYFSEHFPGINFITAQRKKPYPDGIQAIIQRTGLDSKYLLVVDDRLLTGVLAGVISNVQARWITKPYQNFNKRPIREVFFHILRKLEKYVWSFC